jgi:hypothetical protein
MEEPPPGPGRGRVLTSQNTSFTERQFTLLPVVLLETEHNMYEFSNLLVEAKCLTATCNSRRRICDEGSRNEQNLTLRREGGVYKQRLPEQITFLKIIKYNNSNRTPRCFEGTNSGPVPVAARSKARTVYDRSKTGIAASNSARRMDVCPHFNVLCCPVCR